MIFTDGGIFEKNFSTPAGSVTVLADVHIFDLHLVLDELLFYPTDDPGTMPIGLKSALAISRALQDLAKEQGFTEMTVGFPSHRRPQTRAYNQLYQEVAMTIADPRTIDSSVSEEVATMFRSGCAHHLIIARMRALGLHKIECMKLFREHGDVSLGRAKDIIHLSPVWADRYEADEAFHDSAQAALESIETNERTAA